MSTVIRVVTVSMFILLAGGARAGDAGPAAAKAKAKYLAGENAEQKKLRAELAAVKGSKILFNANVNGRYNIHIMNPDGSQMKQLTSDGGTYPHLSPDGKKIAFCRGNYDHKGGETLSRDEIEKLPFDPSLPLDVKRVRPGKISSYLWIMNVDGSNARRVAHGILPHWSPNGKAIAYTIKVGRKWRAAILDVENNVERILKIQGLVVGGFPSYSPDGKWLFVTQGPGVLVPMNASQTDVAPDGKLHRAIGGHPCNGEISPDGASITWVVDTHGASGSWLQCGKFDSAAGTVTGNRDLNLGWDRASVNYYPDFSPSGTYYVYAHAERRPNVKSWLVAKEQELYVARFPPDGTAVRITWGGTACQHPHWAPVK
ncbi:hypothetical protein ACFL01_02165 [Planctomycetota bacterium]